jgi:hypothetical protein
MIASISFLERGLVNRLVICSNESSKSVKPEELEQYDFLLQNLIFYCRIVKFGENDFLGFGYCIPVTPSLNAFLRSQPNT